MMELNNITQAIFIAARIVKYNQPKPGSTMAIRLGWRPEMGLIDYRP